MGSYLSSATTGPRQPRRLATAAIGVVAVIGLVTACTASSVGAAKDAPERYPDRYPAGATGQVTTTPLADTPESIRLEKAARRAISVTGAGAQRYPDRYPAGATGQVTTTPLADTPESIRLEKAARRAISMTVTRSGALSETELMRQEHQPGHFDK